MDSDSPFEVVSEPASEDMSFLGDRLYDFNADTSGFRDGVVFGVFVRDDDGEMVAGCMAKRVAGRARSHV